MNKGPLWFILSFAFIVLIQVLFMNNLQFSGYINPYFYILYILILPINIPKYLILLLGFILGITIDLFSNTPGIHASATVLVSFIRPFLFNTYNLEDQEKSMLPTISNLGFIWFIRYAAVIIITHHLFLFYIEVFSFHGFINTLFRCFFSSIFTFIFVVVSQFLIFRK